MKYSLEFEHSGSGVCLLSIPISTSCLTSGSPLSVNKKSFLSLIFTICKSGESHNSCLMRFLGGLKAMVPVEYPAQSPDL